MKQEARSKVLMIILAAAFFLNLVAINLLQPSIEELVVAGWIVFGIGALLFALSVVTLSRKGVSKIVDSGVYAVVRHPMYLGAMMMFVSHVFMGQNWIVAVGTVVATVCCYLIILLDEQQNLERFGDEYKRYMKRVPRINLFVGIVRLIS